MSKLLKLKDWLTLDDAARHLATMFGEDVTRADILRLALDGRMTLSVNLINGAVARCGPLVSSKNAKYIEYPKHIFPAKSVRSAGDYQGEFIKVPVGVALNDGDVIELGDDLVSLRGVYDLPMIGNERLDVEHMYQGLTGGPRVTLHGFDGAFVLAGEKAYCQLQESLDENEFQRGSLAQGRKLESFIEGEQLDAETAANFRAQYQADREQFRNARAGRPAKRNYYPAGGLPEDAVLVVRTDELLKVQEEASGRGRRRADLGTRERDTLLKLVIGMAMAGYKYSPDAARSGAISDIASDLERLGLGVTDDTVRKWLKVAATSVLPEEPPRT